MREQENIQKRVSEIAKGPSKAKFTVSDIARQAGVSKATVSRVLNSKAELVKGDTYQKVMEAASLLGYQKSPSLPKSAERKPVLVLNIAGYENIFYNKLIAGAASSALSHNCHLLVTASHVEGPALSSFLQLLEDTSADGVIVMNTLPTDALVQIRKLVPVVQCSEYNKESGFPFVTINNRRSAKMATEYLINSGSERIAMINGPTAFRYARERQEGFLDAMNAAGLSIPRSWIVQLPEINYDLAYSAICQLLSNDAKPNAFFCVSDTLAAAALKAAIHFGYHVPKDIRIVGFDNTDASSMCTPSITTVSQPSTQQGFTACEMLINLINHPDAEVNSIFLETELIVREST